MQRSGQRTAREGRGCGRVVQSGQRGELARAKCKRGERDEALLAKLESAAAEWPSEPEHAKRPSKIQPRAKIVVKRRA